MPYRYLPCVGSCPHRKLYTGPEATVWTCMAERRIWTDPPSERGFRITFSMDGDVLDGPTFEWL